MSEVQVVYRQPTSGSSVDEATCRYFKTGDNLPAIRLQVSTFWRARAEDFVFRNHALGVKLVPDEKALSYLRGARFSKAARLSMGAGLLGRLIIGAIASGTAQLGELQGLAVLRANEENCGQVFVVVATRQVITEIVDSMPAENVAPDWMAKFGF